MTTQNDLQRDHATDRNRGLDAVRGVCALLVVCYHFLAWTGIAAYESLASYPVYMFFLLSSLTLNIVYRERFSNGIQPTVLFEYIQKRFARIFPLLFLVSSIYFVLYVVVQHKNFSTEFTRFIFTAFGFFAFHAAGMLSNATGAWSLGIEILFYLMFPTLIVLANQLRTRGLIFACTIALLVQNLATTYILEGATIATAWAQYVLFASFLYYFVAGFLLVRFSRALPSFCFWFGLLITIGVSGLSCYTRLKPEDLVIVPYGVLFPMLLTLGVYLIKNANPSRSFARVFGLLGEISYSSYLIHPLVYQVTKLLAKLLAIGGAAHGALFAILVVISSYGSFVLFESPMRRWFSGQRA